MISFIAYLEIINVVLSDPIISLSVAASAADATAFNPGDTKTLLSNGLSIFSIKGNPVFSNGPKSLPKNPPDCPIFYVIKFLTILYKLKNYLQKLYYAFKFLY